MFWSREEHCQQSQVLISTGLACTYVYCSLVWAFCRCSLLQSVQVTERWVGPGSEILFNAHGAVVE